MKIESKRYRAINKMSQAVPSELIECFKMFINEQIQTDPTSCVKINDCVIAFLLYMISIKPELFLKFCKHGHIPAELCMGNAVSLNSNKLYLLRYRLKTILLNTGHNVIGKKLYGARCVFPKKPDNTRISSNILESIIYFDVNLDGN